MKKVSIKLASIFLLSILMISCDWNDDVQQQTYDYSYGISIFVNNGKVGVTSVRNKNDAISTEYWIDSVKTDSATFTDLLPANSFYRTSINKNYIASSIFRKSDNSVVVYGFTRLENLNPYNHMMYYKDNVKVKLDTTAIGMISAAAVTDNKTVFAGYFGESAQSPSGNYLLPTKPFYWDGTSYTKLPMPSGVSYFNGMSCIYIEGDDVYTSPKINFPMYWKNTEAVILSPLEGEVTQIKVVGTDVYAVGYYQKQSSSSIYTACYWKNGTITELEEGAFAYGIFIDGSDVYVTGAIGIYAASYKACYWKNGERVMLKNN
ncbi:conserved exported hypothetical protein [uncultured Paludibacter sp.]|uniref:Lipoprotein n=1 Tax=uncultured Paludibacter sp. TaxID=497635 RepID=A0A653A835_9BACT|nr:conserved exported hypothetical protein [uncultured Paludibacter sp.]